MLPPARELNFRFLAFFRFLEKHCFPTVFSRFWVPGRGPNAPLRTLLAASGHLQAPSQRWEVLGGCRDSARRVLGRVHFTSMKTFFIEYGPNGRERYVIAKS